MFNYWRKENRFTILIQHRIFGQVYLIFKKPLKLLYKKNCLDNLVHSLNCLYSNNKSNHNNAILDFIEPKSNICTMHQATIKTLPTKQGSSFL